MKYTKPAILLVQKADSAIQGTTDKGVTGIDSQNPMTDNRSDAGAYEADE